MATNQNPNNNQNHEPLNPFPMPKSKPPFSLPLYYFFSKRFNNFTTTVWANNISHMHRTGAVILYRLLKPPARRLVDEGDAEEPWDLRVVDATYKEALEYHLRCLEDVKDNVATMMRDVGRLQDELGKMLSGENRGGTVEMEMERIGDGGVGGEGRDGRVLLVRQVLAVAQYKKEEFLKLRLSMADTVATMRAMSPT